MTTSKITLDFKPGGYIPTIHLSQYDKGETIQVAAFYDGDSYTIPDGSSVYIIGAKPNKYVYMIPCTFSGSTVTIPVHQSMTTCAGVHVAELRVVDGSDVLLNSGNIRVDVEEGPIKDDSVVDSNDLPDLEKILESLGNAAELSDKIDKSVKDAQAAAKDAQDSAKTVADASTAAKQAETDAETAATNASNSATVAGTHEQNSSDNATKAQSYAVGGTNSRDGEDTDNAKYYANQASSDVDKAQQAATNAKNDADIAQNSRTASDNSAKVAQSYAIGGTDTRDGENTDNAKYYKEQAAQSATNAENSASNASSSAAEAKKTLTEVQTLVNNLSADDSSY